MKTVTKLTVLLTLLMGLAGCRFITGENGVFRDRSERYVDAQILPPMEIPFELDSYTIDQLYVIPELVSADSEAFERVPLPKPIETRRSEGVIIQALGNKRWVVIDATPSQVWPLVRDYWTSLQIFLDYENPSSGIMETAWVEIGSDADLRHKYRIKIEPGLHAGYSEVYITHLENLKTDPIPVVITWPEISNSQDLEREVGDSISQYLADRNDLYQASSASLLAGSIEAASKANIVEKEDGESVLELRTDYNRAWVIVRQALQEADIEITDSDRDQAFYNVSFSGVVEEEDEPGFIGRMFRRGSKGVPAAAAVNFTVRLREENSIITVVPETQEDIENISDKSLELLRVINDNLS